MLHLLDTPHWRHAAGRAELPNTLPGWSIAYLAARGAWVTREHLCALLWPDAAAPDAQHSLRVNLYRVRALLQAWGVQAELAVERRRVRLNLPSDVAALRQAMATGDHSAALAWHRQPLLAGMGLPGFAALAEWAELERAALQQLWREAALARLSEAQLAAAPAMELCQILLLADPLDEPALSHQLRRLAELGRHSEARRLYEQFAQRHRHAMGLEPPAMQVFEALQQGRVPAPRATGLATVGAETAETAVGARSVSPDAAPLPAWANGAEVGPAVAAPPARDLFVGRAMELDQLQAMLGADGGHPGRVVSLIGPGGVGKSRLARELVKRLSGQWPQAPIWVALADLGDGAACSRRLAEQLGLALTAAVDPNAQLGPALAQRQALIVLDNAEHLSDLPVLLGQWQQLGSAITWLVTSRQALGLPQERHYTLEGLDCGLEVELEGGAAGSEEGNRGVNPADASVQAEQTLASASESASTSTSTSTSAPASAQHRVATPGAPEAPNTPTPPDTPQPSIFELDAMRLLCARVAVCNSDIDLAAQAGACLALLRATGGWPLAIELAAAAVAQHGVQAVLDDLHQSIDALGGAKAPQQARHDSMRASLMLSWRLLGANEQSALAALGAFRGAFGRAAALAVAGASGPLLARLLQRSLLQVLGPGHYELHPLVAQFAAERLTDTPEHGAQVARAHAQHFSQRLQASAGAAAQELPALWQDIASDFEDHRVAFIQLLAQGEAAGIARSAAAWSAFGSVKGRARELTQLIAAAMPATAADAGARCAVLQAAANLHYRAGELDSAQGLARQALAAAMGLGDDVGQRASQNLLALVLKDQGHYDEAERCARAALQSARAAGAEREVAANANTCAILARLRGDFLAAAALYQEAIAIHRRGANPRSLAMCLNNLGNVHRVQAQLAQAQASFDESLRIAEQHGLASTRAFALVNLGLVHLQAGRLDLALSFAQRAAGDSAAEIGVLLGADVVRTQVAIAQQRHAAAQMSLRALATRAQQAGLHSAMLEAVNCHALMLAALGRPDEALARWLYLIEHPQQPAAERGQAQQQVAALAPTPAERRRAQGQAERFELELLMQAAIAGD